MQPPSDVSSEPDGSPERFKAVISTQERLCRELEILADHLPDRVDTLAAQMLAEALCPTLQNCHRHEEVFVFPVILAWDRAIGPTVARLRSEHVEDEDHAELVAEAVTGFVRSPRRGDADRLGYLLRGLFQPLMRHSAFDRDVTLPLFRQAREHARRAF